MDDERAIARQQHTKAVFGGLGGEHHVGEQFHRHIDCQSAYQLAIAIVDGSAIGNSDTLVFLLRQRIGPAGATLAHGLEIPHMLSIGAIAKRSFGHERIACLGTQMDIGHEQLAIRIEVGFEGNGTTRDVRAALHNAAAVGKHAVALREVIAQVLIHKVGALLYIHQDIIHLLYSAREHLLGVMHGFILQGLMGKPRQRTQRHQQ